jgi:integrase
MQILERDEEESGIEEEDQLRTVRREREKRFPRGAQQRAFRLSLADLQRLLDELRARGERGSEASDWYMSTVLTGLRPCEWRSAELVGDSLCVSNAKSTNGRAFGPTRTIDVSGLLGFERECLIRHLAALEGQRDEPAFARKYKAVRTVIRDAGQRLWPKRLHRPSLYTARHQFAAGAKTTWPPAEVAALMGHASTRSAPAYYAPARSAVGGVRVRPSDADVRAVKAKNALEFLSSLESRDT